MDRFVVRTARQEWQSQGVQQPSTSRGQQRTLYSLTKVVRLPPGTTPRVFSVDYLLSVKAVLDDSSSGKEALVDSIRQLSSLIMTESHLVESGIGRSIRRLAKHSQEPGVRSLALGLLKAWREAVKSERNGTSAAVGPVRNSQQQQTTKRPTPYPRPGTASTSGSGRHMLPPSSFFGAQAPSGPTVDEALRGRVRSCLHTALGGSHEGLGNGSREAGAAHADSGSDDGMLAAAFGIEDEMHSRLAHMAPKAYRQKARELQANLRRNAGLRVAVLDGRLAPEQLLNMTPDQLGGEHL